MSRARAVWAPSLLPGPKKESRATRLMHLLGTCSHGSWGPAAPWSHFFIHWCCCSALGSPLSPALPSGHRESRGIFPQHTNSSHPREPKLSTSMK